MRRGNLRPGTARIRSVSSANRKPRQEEKITAEAEAATPEAAANEAGLRYVNDEQAGYTRQRRGKKFVYFDIDGKEIRDEVRILRLDRLAIPPAYTEVWICPSSNGHLQATGRDDRGRKQYRYHDRWREVRDENKFERIIVFAKTLPKLRRRVQRDLKLRGLAREKVLATLVQLLERTFIRVGNEEYAKDNNSFGLTTLRNRHVQVRGANLRFRFRGKSGKEHDIPIEDRRIALIVKKLQELPGQDIFQYLDESGERRQVTSEDVNQYLRSIAGDAFTAKDFRTWAGTVLTSIALKELKPFENITEAKNNLKLAINAVAKILGNTATICRKCYVHPVVVSSYLEGTLVGSLMNQTKRTVSQGGKGLRLEELNVLRLLQSRLPKK